MRQLRSVAFLLLLVPGIVVAASDVPLDRGVLWMSHDPSSAQFVPAALMKGLALDDLPINGSARKRLDTELDRARTAQSEERACAAGEDVGCGEDLSFQQRVDRELAKLEPTSEEQRAGLRRMIERSIRSVDGWKATHPGPCQYANPSGIGIGEPSPKPFDFEDHLTRNAEVFAGHVVDTVVGWSTYSDRAVTLTYVEVDEVFRDLYEHLWPGKQVAFEQAVGELQFQGVRLCTLPGPGKLVVKTGDEVLAFGAQQAPTATWMEVSWLYPVVDETILPPSSPLRGRNLPQRSVITPDTH